MKRIILTGGIGNQLFKSLGAIKASSADLRSISFDVTWYQAKTFTNGITASRRFELTKFPSFSEVPIEVRNSHINKIESRLIESCPELMEKIGYKLNMKSTERRLVPPKVYKCDFEDFNALPSKRLLLEYLKFPSTSSEWTQSLKKIAQTEKAIAVHVRRSDYLSFSNIYPKLGLSYYVKSLEFTRSKLGKLPIWLFSDDAKEVIREFGNAIKFDRVITPPAHVPMIEMLELFSLMKGVITANSTFSWWGAYLGSLQGNVEQITIPERFTNLESDPGLKLRTPGWKVIPI